MWELILPLGRKPFWNVGSFIFLMQNCFLSAGIVIQAKGRIWGQWQQCGHCWRACHCWKACSRGMCGSLFQ